MNRLLHKTPILIRKIFPSFQWESKTNKILFTFDDGPIPETTPLILNKLNSLGIKAVFFCVGQNIKKNPELAKELISEGHEIANHTMNHQRINFKERQFVINEIQSFEILRHEILGNKSKYFRPPHGIFDLSSAGILKGLNLSNIMWSIMTADYTGNLETVKLSIKKYLEKNSIIVLHDSLKSKQIIKDSIDYIAEYCAENNFEIGTPSECLK